MRWLYVLYYECRNNVTKAANKIGVSREWLSKTKSKFERCYRDPRRLEPESRAPYDTSKRKRISREIENKILEVREKYGWGKEKISAFLFTENKVKVHPNTVNKYLHIHKKIDPKLSLKNIEAFRDKKQRESERIVFKVRYRPPSRIKDYAPGALVEKDMKYVLKLGQKAFQRKISGISTELLILLPG